jgi:hypothetical protein
LEKAAGDRRDYKKGIHSNAKRIIEMTLIADQPINTDQPAPPVFIDDLVVETAHAIADLTKVVTYLAATKTLPVSTEAAMVRLRGFCGRLQG